MNDSALEYTKSLDTRRFLAGIKEKLIAKADSKVGAILGNPSLDHLPETRFTKLTCTITEGSHTGNNEGGTPNRVGGVQDMDAIRPGMLDGTLYAAEISAAVIDQSEKGRITHSTPLVLGIPFTRSSWEKATSRALPSALKIASAI
jgi:hypothetical protein